MSNRVQRRTEAASRVRNSSCRKCSVLPESMMSSTTMISLPLRGSSRSLMMRTIPLEVDELP